MEQWGHFQMTNLWQAMGDNHITHFFYSHLIIQHQSFTKSCNCLCKPDKHVSSYFEQLKVMLLKMRFWICVVIIAFKNTVDGGYFETFTWPWSKYLIKIPQDHSTQQQQRLEVPVVHRCGIEQQVPFGVLDTIWEKSHVWCGQAPLGTR